MVMILQPLAREAILAPGFWRFSPPVPFIPRSVIEREAREPSLPESELPVLWAALDAVDNTGEGLGYDDWRDVAYAVHWATGGSAEGLAQFEAWSERSSKHVPGYAEEKIWNYADQNRVGGITAATLFKRAAAAGWLNPATHAEPDGEGFELEGAAAAAARVGEPEQVESVSASREIGPPRRQTSLPGTQVATSPPEGYEPPAYYREKKSGLVLATVENAVRALRDPWEVGTQIAQDTFRDELLVQPAGAVQQWRPITDADIVRLRIALEQRKFKVAPKELARDAAVLVAEENQFDSAQLWLEGVEPCWDGVHRCETFLRDAFGCADTPYTRAVSLYIWTALAGRVIEPGVQADMAPILEGDQGLRKTSALAAMVPDRMFFTELDLTKDDDTLARLLRGTLVGEISELRGLQTKDQESIKSWISRRYEKWVPKFKEFSTVFPRRCILFGTTNRTDILADETGNRRWLPVHVTAAAVEWIESVREQLWAEGAAIFRGVPQALQGAKAAGPGFGGGVAFAEAERLARAEHGAYTRPDPWSDAFTDWLGGCDGLDSADAEAEGRARGMSPFTITDALAGALGMPTKEMSTQTQMRAGAVLRGLGFAKSNRRLGGSQKTCWVRPSAI